MREILFRGKREDNGEWIEGNYILQNDNEPQRNNYMKSYIKLRNYVNIYKVLPETVGQYTGLTDKNGKKIFEGDIIKDDWGKIYKVFYSLKSCSFMLECAKTPNEWEKGHYRIGEAWCKTIRVIGNIYDNSELLEDTK